MHIEWSLLNEEGTTVGESQSNVEIISIGRPASHRRVETLRLGNTIYFMEKDPMVSFFWPWGLSLLLTEGQEVLKLFEVWATSHYGDENKEKTKQKTPIHLSSKWVILESPGMGGLSIWLNFHLKKKKMPMHRNAYFIFEYWTVLCCLRYFDMNLPLI